MFSIVLIKLLILTGLEAPPITQQTSIQARSTLKMFKDLSGLPDTTNEEISLHKVWRLKYLNKLHPMFSGMYMGFIEDEWDIVDFTNPDTARITQKDGEQYSVPYRKVNDELIFPKEGKKKKIKKK